MNTVDPGAKRRFRAVLVDGIFHEPRLVPSCGIAAIGAYVREQGFAVELFAPNNRRLDEEEAVAKLLDANPDFIGVSLLTRFTFPSFLRIAKLLRENDYRGFLCVGGHGASIAYRQLLDEVPQLDAVVVGDGEETCVELMTRLVAGQDWRDIVGIARRDPLSGDAVHTGVRALKPLDDLPLIATDLIAELVEHYGPNVRAGLVTSRGCYADCSYCSVKAFTKLQGVRPYRMRSVEKVVDEIEMVQRKFGVKNISLEDDNFLVPRSPGIRRAREFNRLVKERGLELNLTLQTRPECITYEGIGLLKEVGLSDIFIGTESFDQETLNLYHRNNTVDQSRHAFEVFEAHGFSASVDAKHRVRVGSMVFHPYITLDELYPQAEEFRRFQIPAKKLVKRLRPAEDVRLCQRFEAEGLLDEDGEYRYVHPEVAHVYQTLRRYYAEFMTLREDIRVVEKKVQLHGLDSDVSELRALRMAIDDSFLDLFEELCVAGKESDAAVDAAYAAKVAEMRAHLNIDAVREQVQRHLERLDGLVLNN